MPPTNRKELDSRRVLARLIDMLVVAVPAAVVVALHGGPDLELWLLAVAAELSYLFMLEATVGQTLGKQLMGLKVARVDGSPAGIAAIATRTVFRVLEDNFLGLIVMVLSGKRRQRIGDLFAGTIVTRATEVPGLPASSPMVVVYPVLWIASAFTFGHYVLKEDPYLKEVAAVCDARLATQERMPHPLSVGVVLEMSSEETRRIARLQPTPEFRLWHRAVVREKREFDLLGQQFARAMASSHDPSVVIAEHQPRLMAEAEQHNALFREVGLDNCAR
jgi:uncharacterized RDD family membrane protein YckC